MRAFIRILIVSGVLASTPEAQAHEDTLGRTQREEQPAKPAAGAAKLEEHGLT